MGLDYVLDRVGMGLMEPDSPLKRRAWLASLTVVLLPKPLPDGQVRFINSID